MPNFPAECTKGEGATHHAYSITFALHNKFGRRRMTCALVFRSSWKDPKDRTQERSTASALFAVVRSDVRPPAPVQYHLKTSFARYKSPCDEL
jgi:hypothetical protein